MCTSQGHHTTLYQPRTRTAFVWACVWVWAWMGLGVWAGCPKVCECFWRDGKQMVACRDADFIDIPRGIEPSTQVLDLSHNNLRILPRNAFVYTGLVNLQKVILSHCNLRLLEKGSFNSVENVMELDLSNNELRSVPSAALMDMRVIRELSIADNALTTIPTSAFTHTPYMVQLDLSRNRIHTIEAGALRNLTELEILNLSDNMLTFLNASELEPLLLLRVIRIDGNPWQCNCYLRPLRQWFHDRGLAASVPPSCSYPKWLMGRDWQLLENEEFLCAPRVTAIAPRVLGAHGENVSLLCRVETEVETTITWFVGDAPLYNDSDLQRYLVVEMLTSNNSSYVSNLTITDVVSEDQGTYRCVAENRAGLRETNFTLQVSHEVAEVRVANIDVSYMKEGLLIGVSILIFVLLLVCSVVYCRLRVTRVQRQDEDSVDTAQSSRSSECDPQHKLAGYHMVPTSDVETSPHRQQSDPPWGVRGRGAAAEDFPPGNVLDVSIEERQEMPEGPAAQAMASSALSTFVDNAKREICGMHHSPVERTHWKDRMHPKDIFLHRVCSRSVSQMSLSSSRQYPDLLDLPHSQLGVQLQQHVPLQDGGQELQTLVTSTCPRPRTHSDAGSRAGGGAAVEPSHSRHPLAHHAALPNQDHTECSRSSSALNLALSQAASNAYANAHLSAGGHQCLAAAPALQTHAPEALRQLTAMHSSVSDRSETGGGTSGICSQQHAADPCHFEYHAAQLEKFLKEYRCLQEQLIHMKQSYEAHKRAGSVPRLNCCSSSPGGPMTSTAVFPDGAACCSCNLQAPCMPPAALQPLPGEFAETSLTEPSTGGYVEASALPLSTGGFAEAPEPQTSSDGRVDPAIPQASSAGYPETAIGPAVRYVDSATPQLHVTGPTDSSPKHHQPSSEGCAEAPAQRSPARGSPSAKTSTRATKEPLKSILKKSSEGGGLRRCDQWTRSASCCDSQTSSQPPTDPHPTADPYPAADPPYPAADSHPAADPNSTTDQHPTTSGFGHTQHSCYGS
ncbi:uncharacterized protein [Panulirus ornatus]|uniref:uncharacterized protein isoform X3 n=1 Tax=Panulirus ornatus TaxID=150431 RepID=UPI003A8AA7F6